MVCSMKIDARKRDSVCSVSAVTSAVPLRLVCVGMDTLQIQLIGSGAASLYCRGSVSCRLLDWALILAPHIQ